MGKSLLELIGTQKLQQDISKNIFLADEVIKSGYYNDFEVSEAYKLKLPYDRSDNNNDFNSVAIDVIGEEALNSISGLNFFGPEDGYVQESVFYNDVFVLNSPPIEEIGQTAYFDIISYNKYANLEYICEVVTEPVAPTSQLQDYIEYISTIKRNIDINGMNYVDIILGNVGFEDSALGVIGSEALKTHFNENVAAHLEKKIIGKINTNPLSILRGDSFIVKDYEITVGANFIERTADFILKLSGAELPISPIVYDAWGLYENKGESTEYLTEELLSQTGKAQQKNLQRLLELNQFKPKIVGRGFEIDSFYYLNDIKTNTSSVTPFDSSAFNGLYVAGQSEALDANDYGMKYITKSQITDFGSLADREAGNVEWYVDMPNYFGDTSLLYKTANILNNLAEANSLSFADQQAYDAFLNMTATEFKDEVNGVIQTISRGSTITSKGAYTADDGSAVKANEYFRVFTKTKGYNRLSRTLRHSGLNNGDKRSVLGDNGLVQIAPTVRNRGLSDQKLYRKYMFSIENLAWNDNISDLPDCEIGPGDGITGHRGRIMWFPPYNLSFNESSTVNWSQHDFIGRGEAIYTYNNTVRTGTLTFNLIVDHPEIVNKIRGKYSYIWERYFRGDKSVVTEINNLAKIKLNPKERDELEKIKDIIQPKEFVADHPVTPTGIQQATDKAAAATKQSDVDKISLVEIYFPNEETNLPSISGEASRNAGYENGDINNFPQGLGYTYLNGVQRKNFKYRDNTNFGLNKKYYTELDSILLSNFSSVLNKNPKTVTVTIIGSASSAITTRISNFDLGTKRAENTKLYIQQRINDLGIIKLIPPDVELKYEIESTGDLLDLTSAKPTTETDAPDLFSVKKERSVKILLSYSTEEVADTPTNTTTVDDLTANQNLNPDPLKVKDSESVQSLQVSTELLDKLLYTECDFFDYLEINDPYTYATISEKIKYFSPAFHSTTPQGFNSRLTFLHQCTRQGSSPGIDGITNVTNLAFGRPPVCILRVGDFFYTKIIIDSLSITYEPLIWDLNPEGIGVQPMIATVTLNIKILGGSSMSGPINRLQNAMSYNFYANTEMYDVRSDSIEFIINEKNPEGVAKVVDGLKLSNLWGTNNVNSAENLLKITNESGIYQNDILKNPTPEVPQDLPSEIDDINNIIELKKALNLYIDEKNK